METEKIFLIFQNSQEVLKNFLKKNENLLKISLLINKIYQTIKNGNKILSCGNGGSMCDAMHFAEELTGRFKEDRIPLPALSISDPAHLSCVANDYGFEKVFSRYIEAIGKDEDLLLLFSTSGNSNNLIEAVKSAKKKNLKIFCLLGKDGGKLKQITDDWIVIPSDSSARIQEMHIKIVHIVIEIVESFLKEKKCF